MRVAVYTLAFVLLAAALVGVAWTLRSAAGSASQEPAPSLPAPPAPGEPPAGVSGIAALSWSRGARAWKEGRYADAAALFGRAAAGVPASAEARFHLGASYLMDGLGEPARQQLRRAVALDAGNPSYRYYLGEAEALAGDVPAARRELAAAERLGGPWAEAARRSQDRLGLGRSP